MLSEFIYFYCDLYVFDNLLTLGYVARMRSVQHAVHELIYFFYNNHELVYLNSRVMLCGKKKN